MMLIAHTAYKHIIGENCAMRLVLCYNVLLSERVSHLQLCNVLARGVSAVHVHNAAHVCARGVKTGHPPPPQKCSSSRATPL